MSEQDELNDLLALGGAFNRQINASNSMMIEQGKSTIPKLDPRKLIADMGGGKASNRTTPPPPLPQTANNTFVDPDLGSLNIAPMAGLIPLDEALTEDMKIKGVRLPSLQSNVVNPVIVTPVNTPALQNVISPNVILPKIDKNQIEFEFVSKLGAPKYSTYMEYFEERFKYLEAKLIVIDSKLSELLNRKRKV